MPYDQYSLIADVALLAGGNDANKGGSGFILLCIIKYLTIQILPI